MLDTMLRFRNFRIKDGEELWSSPDPQKDPEALFSLPCGNAYALRKARQEGRELPEEDVEIPCFVKRILPSAFAECPTLRSVRFPRELKGIGERAFYHCLSLRSVKIPAGVRKIGAEAFLGCSRMQEILFPESGCCPELAPKTLMNCSSLTEVRLPEGIDSLPERFFYGCLKLTTVYLPVSLRRIEKEAFSTCPALKKIRLPEGLQMIGDDAFYGARSLESVCIPSTCEVIGRCAFYWCRGLKEAVLREGIKRIGPQAFQVCDSLKKITFPDGCMAADNVLSGNSHLEDVTFLGLPPKTFYVFKEVRLHTPHPERFDERTFEDAVYSFTRAPERFTPEEQDAYRKEIDLRTNMSAGQVWKKSVQEYRRRDMDILKVMAESGIVPVVVLDDAKDAVNTAKALLAGGIKVMEITFRTSAAEQAIKNVAAQCPEIVVGAGTVITLEQCRTAVNAGAKFIVAPGYDEEVVSWCVEHEIPVTPGCVTPTEIMMAMKHGLHVLKFFPANVYGGLKALKSLSGPFTGITFIPTGGVNNENAGEFAAAPCVHAVGGSWICPKADIAAGNFERITRLSREARTAYFGYDEGRKG